MKHWIEIKNQLPPCGTDNFYIAYHTVYGVGVAMFWRFAEDDGIIEELEEDYEDKYLCSCDFLKRSLDGNYSYDKEEDIDIFENSPHFRNLGTVTHWMDFPPIPSNAEIYREYYTTFQFGPNPGDGNEPQ